jgi:nanoRNase/pAp phosphatase (c-di-AMP/oligoRNAs hydrolase)
MPSLAGGKLAKSDQLLSLLAGCRGCLIVTHDNPDPDAIAAGWGLQCLVREKLKLPTHFVGGGAIVRAENRHMVELLHPPIELVDRVECRDERATILVDCSPGTTNHLLARAGIRPLAVIDHHLNGSGRVRLPFKDVRPKVAAAASIAASYLREQAVEPGAKLATAMQYAIRTETSGSETRHSRLDRSILLWLAPRAEPELLAEIENAPLSREYFGDLVLAMQSAFLYDDVALCLLPRAHCAEIVGEVADLLIRCRSVRRVLCGAMVDHDLILSARTERDGDNAAKLIQKTLEGIGFAGGHAHRAGGKIPGNGTRSKIGEDLENELRTRWLTACNVDRQRGTRLVSKRDIVENL